MNFPEEFIEFLTDSASTRTDDYLSLNPSPILWEEDQVWESEVPAEATGLMTCICKVCGKNTVDIEQENPSKRKRRKVEVELPQSTAMVCSECLSLTVEQASNLRKIPEKGLLLLKRAQAKRKTQDTLQRLKEEEAQVMEKAAELPLADQRRLKQMMRNRISAQQSRDRKKNYELQLEKEIIELKQDNAKLCEKVQTLEHENSLLRSASARQVFGGRDNSPRIGAISLVLGTLVAVCLVASMLQPVPTASLQPIGRHLLSVTSNNEIKFSQAYQPDLSNSSHALALPDQKML